MNASRYLRLAAATLCLLLLLLPLNHAHELQVRSCRLDVTRLSRRVLPEHYKLDLHIPYSSDTFSGDVEIDVSLNIESQRTAQMPSVFGKIRNKLRTEPLRITLHADPSLQIYEAGFVEVREGAKTTEHEVLWIYRDYEKGLVAIDLNKPKSSHGQLRFAFTGTINKQAEGVFNSSTIERKLITTQFEPGMARKAFPCFDEPDFKAEFDLSIELPQELTALSNMEPDGSKLLESKLVGFRRVGFQRTPKMSAYLLAFAVGEFGQIEAESKGVKLTMWTPPGRDHSAETRLKTAVSAYEVLLDYFEIEQPLKKIDFVAVDVVDGVMENWGLITFDSALIADQRHLSPYKSYRVSVSVVRELACSWFGHLVTMKWWDDLWLYEGLASWLARIVLSKIQPDYDYQMFFLLTTMMETLDVDSLESRKQPIKRSQEQTVEEIKKSFDPIIYQKAECVINMLVNHLGDLEFQQAIRYYISKNVQGNAGADDLWGILEQVSSNKVGVLMNSWLYQEGHPIVEVQLSGGMGSYRLRMRQSRFPSSYPDDEHLWIIPITILISSDGHKKPVTVKFVLSYREDSMQLPTCFDPAEHWLKLNANYLGFYRVRYRDERLLSALRLAVESKEMQPADRLNLIDEARALLKARLVSEKSFKQMVSWFRYEDNDGAIVGLVKTLKAYNKIARQKDDCGADILLRYYEQNGRVQFNPQDSKLKVRARADALQYLVLDVHQVSVISDCYEMYKYLTSEGQPVPGPFRHSIYASVAVRCTEAEAEQLFERIGRIECSGQRSIVANAIWNLLHQMEKFGRLRRFRGQLWTYTKV